eukprot:759350-Prymnesium_polylepis.1
MPVILSLEMHCAPKQQNKLALTMIKHFGDRLLRYVELVDTDQASSLSPADLRARILVKGKCKMKKDDAEDSMPKPMRARPSMMSPVRRRPSNAPQMSFTGRRSLIRKSSNLKQDDEGVSMRRGSEAID